MDNKVSFSAVGYKYLSDFLENYDYKFIPSKTNIYLSDSSPCKMKIYDKDKTEIKPYKGIIPSSLFEHIEIALKYEDINLGLLKTLFTHISKDKSLLKDLENNIKKKTTGKTERKIWFLFEHLMGYDLDIPNLGKKNYIDILDEDKYFVAHNPIKEKRYAVNNNFLNSNWAFCPIVRKTEKLKHYVKRDFGQEIIDTIYSYQNKLHLVYSAINYLYVNETRGTFGIESLTPTQSRQASFIKILEEQSRNPIFVTKPSLIKLQNKFVEPRYKNEDYRDNSIYVGNIRLSASFSSDINIDFIGAKVEDIDDLMLEFFACYGNLIYGDLNPVIASAIISFAFVYIHPFSDGNGRISRYLIHNVLSLKGMMPEGLIFPVSAYMLKNLPAYYDALNNFSKEFMALVDYETDNSELNVLTDTKDLYRYIDFTKQAEYLFECIDNTLQEDFKDELKYLERYEQTRLLIKNIVDLPDVKLNNFIMFMKQNENKLPNRRRQKDFTELSDNEIEQMEQIVRDNLLVVKDVSDENISLDGFPVFVLMERLKLDKTYDFVKNDKLLTEEIQKFYPQYKNSENLINLIKKTLKYLAKAQIN